MRGMLSGFWIIAVWALCGLPAFAGTISQYTIEDITLGDDMRTFVATHPTDDLVVEYCRPPVKTTVEVNADGVMRTKIPPPSTSRKPYILRILRKDVEVVVDLAEANGSLLAGKIERHTDTIGDGLISTIKMAATVLGEPSLIAMIQKDMSVAYWGGKPADGLIGDIVPAEKQDDTLEIFRPSQTSGRVIERLIRHSLTPFLRPSVCQ